MFHEYLKKEYSTLITIDVVGLSKMIEIMETSIISDYIILEKTKLNQVFTTISTLPELHPYANHIGMMCKNLLESSSNIEHEITKLRFNLGDKFLVYLEVYERFVLIVIINQKDKEKILKDLTRLKSKINSNFL